MRKAVFFRKAYAVTVAGSRQYRCVPYFVSAAVEGMGKRDLWNVPRVWTNDRQNELVCERLCCHFNKFVPELLMLAVTLQP